MSLLGCFVFTIVSLQVVNFCDTNYIRFVLILCVEAILYMCLDALQVFINQMF